MSKLPFIKSVPQDLIDSRIFKFEVTLPSMFEHFCAQCNVVFDPNLIACPQCQNNQLEKRNKTIRVDLLANVSLDYDTVEHQLADISSELAFWSAVYAEAKYRTNILERMVKTARATAHEQILDAAAKDGVRLAQDAIKTLVEKDERVNRAELQHAQSHMVASKMFYMIEAIRMKADLGRTLTSLKRSESSGS